MNERMVAAIEGTGEVTVRREPVPALREGQVKIRVRASLISPGTEMAGVRARRASPNAAAPAQLFGYSNAGEIIETRGCRDGLEPGMRVAAVGAGYARHETCSCVPVNLVTPLPDGVDYAQAAYASLAATALHSVRRTEPLLGQYGAVAGLGIVGNLASQFYALSGARAIGWEPLAMRADIADRCGLGWYVSPAMEDPVAATRAFAAPYGLDFALIAFGGDAGETITRLMRCMKKAPDGHEMGRLVLVGGCAVPVRGGAPMGNVDIRISSRMGPGYRDERFEHGGEYPDALVGFTVRRNLEEIVRLLAERRLRVDPMTTHRLPLERVGEAADLLIEHPESTLGVVLEMP